MGARFFWVAVQLDGRAKRRYHVVVGSRHKDVAPQHGVTLDAVYPVRVVPCWSLVANSPSTTTPTPFPAQQERGKGDNWGLVRIGQSPGIMQGEFGAGNVQLRRAGITHMGGETTFEPAFESVQCKTLLPAQIARYSGCCGKTAALRTHFPTRTLARVQTRPSPGDSVCKHLVDEPPAP